MNYIVKVWVLKDYSPVTEYIEKDELIEAQEYADKRAAEAKEAGFEFDVAIYELTNF